MAVIWDSEVQQEQQQPQGVLWDTADPGQKALTTAPREPNPRGGDSEALSIPTVSEAYSDMIGPVTEGVAAALRGMAPVKLMEAGMDLGPVKSALSWISNGSITGPPSEEQVQSGANTVARAVVPQNPVEAGAYLAMPFAGPMSRAFGGPASRILAQGLGAGAGSVLQGDDLSTAGTNTLKHGSLALGGESLSALGSAGIRALPNNPIMGGKANIADLDAAKYARAMERAAPDAIQFPQHWSGREPNSQDLFDMAGRARRLIGDLKERTSQQISQMPTGPNMPAYGQYGGPIVTGGGGTVRQSARAYNETHFSNTLLDLPSIGERLTLEEANRRLSEIGARAYGKDPLARTFQGKDQRELYGELAGDMARELRGLNPQAANLFENVQNQVKQGYTLTKPLEGTATTPGPAWRTDSGRVQFNTPKLQDLVNSPRGMAMLREKMGPNADILANDLRRGAPAPRRDTLIEAPGGYLDPAFRLARGESNLGRGSFETGKSLLGLSNLGSRYVGIKPYGMPGTPQAIMDLLMGNYGQ